ncbi:MAG TPA: glycosyltransferase [Gemmatales bacterium]|nr:glycosyltransferase [Gemmatales bacterium]
MLNSLGYLARRGVAKVLRNLLPPPIPAREPDVLPYPAWIAKRLQDRLEEYVDVPEPGLFSLMTPVFDPPSGYLRRLGKSIFAQDHRDWQWVIVDNGCKNRDVHYLMGEFAKDLRVTLVRAGEPRGIIGGMRLALEHAHNRYVCPVDHDDQLYPDALRVLAASLSAHNWPALAYTDEDKLFPDGTPGQPSFKPDWDPLLFLNAFYIAHLGVMDRATALDLGVYTDPLAEGTPDGDAFCRYVAAGHVPLHIPEIVYSWRMHMQSTALRGVEAKPYVTRNQKHVLNRYLHQRGLDEMVTIRTNPLPGLAGSWRVQGEPESIPVVVMPGGEPQARRQLRQRLSVSHNIHSVHWMRSLPHAWQEVLHSIYGQRWVILLSPDCLPLTTDFVSECQAVQQAVTEAVLVGGILQNAQGKVVSAGLAWGMDGLMGSPLAGLNTHDYTVGMGSLCFQRCVSSVDARFCMVRVDFLKQVLERSGCDLGDPLLPAWFAAVAKEQGKRVLFTPNLTGQLNESSAPRHINDETRFRFLCEFGHELPSDPYYSRFLGLTAGHAWQAVKPGVRRDTLQRSLSALADTMPGLDSFLGPSGKYQSWLNHSVINGINQSKVIVEKKERQVA